ncbi:MAG: hypothetical protein MUF58_22655, partial [Arcicella sp.]|nr:hypothetical protein [Arcicella sp.]
RNYFLHFVLLKFLCLQIYDFSFNTVGRNIAGNGKGLAKAGVKSTALHTSTNVNKKHFTTN